MLIIAAAYRAHGGASSAGQQNDPGKEKRQGVGSLGSAPPHALYAYFWMF